MLKKDVKPSYLCITRRQKGLSQQEVAFILNVSRPTYSQWERQPLKMPIGLFIKFNIYFGCDIQSAIFNVYDFKHEVGEPTIKTIIEKLEYIEKLILL
jgi:transcriptional regulator with XRE-family HTH domain